MPESRLKYWFDCYVCEKCSLEEEKELMGIIAKSENEHSIQKLIEKLIEDTPAETQMPEQMVAFILQNILRKDEAKVSSNKGKKAVFTRWMRVAAAAALISVVLKVFYWPLAKESKDKISKSILAIKNPSTILPGGNFAILTMADGSTIILDSSRNGNIKYGNATIHKKNGLLVYHESVPSKPKLIGMYNTLTTLRGCQYQGVLPNGSMVWLNPSSSIHFPTMFIDTLRELELTGEVYFEVAKNKKKPFQVNVNDMQIEIKGTYLNVNAYGNEDAIKNLGEA